MALRGAGGKDDAIADRRVRGERDRVVAGSDPLETLDRPRRGAAGESLFPQLVEGEVEISANEERRQCLEDKSRTALVAAELHVLLREDGAGVGRRDRLGQHRHATAVSYTHLTLPTNREV